MSTKKRKIPSSNRENKVHIPHLTENGLREIYDFCLNKDWQEVKQHFFADIDMHGFCLVTYPKLEDSGFGVKDYPQHCWVHKEELKVFEDSQLCWSGGSCADDYLSFDDFIIYRRPQEIIEVWSQLSKEEQCNIETNVNETTFMSPQKPGWMTDKEFKEREKEMFNKLEVLEEQQQENHVKVSQIIQGFPKLIRT